MHLLKIKVTLFYIIVFAITTEFLECNEHVKALKDIVPDHPHLHDLVDKAHAGDHDAKHEFERKSLSTRYNETRKRLPTDMDDAHVVMHFLDDYTQHMSGGKTEHSFMKLTPLLEILVREEELKQKLVDLGKKLEFEEYCLVGLFEQQFVFDLEFGAVVEFVAELQCIGYSRYQNSSMHETQYGSYSLNNTKSDNPINSDDLAEAESRATQAQQQHATTNSLELAGATGARPSLVSVTTINCEICRAKRATAAAGKSASICSVADERTPINSHFMTNNIKSVSKEIDLASSLTSSSDGKSNSIEQQQQQAPQQQLRHPDDNSMNKSTQHLAPNAGVGEEESRLIRWGRSCPGVGILLALCASLFLGSAGLLVKITQSVHPIEVAMFRAVFQLLIYSGIILFRRGTFRPVKGEYLATASRAILGGVSITCSYTALKMIPLGDATAIRFSLPIWTLIIGHVVLKESCYVINVFAVLVSICGVALIAKPSECMQLLAWITSSDVYKSAVPVDLNISRFEGCLIALCSSICLAVSYISIRMCRKTPAPVVIFWLSVASILVGLITLLTIDQLSMPGDWTDVAFMILNGVCGALGQYCITMALKIEESGPISLARSFDIVVAFAYSSMLLNEEIGVTSSILTSPWISPLSIKETCQTASDNRAGMCMPKKACLGSGGTIISANETYFVSPSFPSMHKERLDPPVCIFTLQRRSIINKWPVCQIKLSFDEFSLAPPINGTCGGKTDSFIVSGAVNFNTSGLPTSGICGDMSGQHIYLDVDPDRPEDPLLLIVNTANEQRYNRRWSIRIQQIACHSPFRAPNGCLQYYTSESGIVESFNFRGNGRATAFPGSSILPIRGMARFPTLQFISSPNYLNDMYYGVCIQKQPRMCAIKWQALQFDFGGTLAGLSDVTSPHSQTYGCVRNDGLVQYGADLGDYIIITGGSRDGKYRLQNQFCGQRLNHLPQQDSNDEIVSYAKPFGLIVRSDSLAGLHTLPQAPKSQK
ncbi:Solute carrier family 35 member G1, partial [Fragariocoptes setiger]